jgi:hypothetical protein
MSGANKYTLKPTLSEKFEGIIWKIETDEVNQQIAIETRLPETKIVQFSVFNYRTGYRYLKEITTENNWWWNMDRIHQNKLFLHGYISENTPEHKGISAIEIESGEIKWQNFQLALEDISEEGLVVFNASLQPKKLQIASLESGQIIKSSASEYVPVSRTITFPDIISLTTIPYFLPSNIVGPVHHITHSGKNLWSFHTNNKQLFSQHLVISENGIVLLSDILASDIQKLNPEAFFIQRNQLFYIRDRNREIVSYLL